MTSGPGLRAAGTRNRPSGNGFGAGQPHGGVSEIAMQKPRFLRLVPLLSALILGCSTGSPLRGQEPSAPVISSRVELVPVDVLLTWDSAAPTPPLAPEDFEVYENGALRPVEHFARFLPGHPDDGQGTAPEEKPLPGDPPGRTFIVFLGRMGTCDPFHSLQDLASFFQNDLVPGDRVALMAYNRMSPFLGDPVRIAALLAKYRMYYRDIEAIMQVRTEDLLGIKEVDFAPDVQALIDRIFDETGSVPGRASTGIAFPTSRSLSRLSRIDREQGGKALMDLQNLHRAIGILEYQPGAKHILYFSADGLFLRNPASDHELGLAANVARVAVHTFQTGGMDSGYTRQGVSTQTALGSIRKISDLSGGLCFVHTPVQQGLEKVNALSRAAVVIGFVPANGGPARGEFRSIRIKCRRPGLTLHYRKNYRG